MASCSCKRFCLIVGLILLEGIDLFLDWDFYYEVSKTDQQPIKDDKPVKIAILAFAIVGSITFILQLFSIYFDARKDYKHLTYSASMSFIATWIEDIPQIALAIYVAAVSSELISNIQIGKAIYAVIEAVIHIIMSCWQCCCKRDDFRYKSNSECLRALITMDLIGGIVILISSAFLLFELHEDKFN